MSTETAPLTRKAFKDMSVEELKKIVNDPTRLMEANNILDGSVVLEIVETPPDAPSVVLSPEDEAAALVEADRIAAETATAEADEAVRKETEKAAEAVKAAELAEAYKAAGVSVETDATGNITKLVMNYQARDEAGNAIGRSTYLEAKTWFELVTKQRAAHENAVRFAERLKKQKLTIRKEDPNEPKALTEEELVQLQEDLKGEDRAKATKAADQIRSNDVDKAITAAREAKASFEFLAAHLQDYNRCEANNKMLSEYVRGNNLEWTPSNLELAFIAIETQLEIGRAHV